MWKVSLSAFVALPIVIALGTASGARAEDAVPAGQKIFVDNKCTQCHAIKALNIAKVKSDEDEEKESEEGGKKREPPDLSAIGKDHDAAWFTKWLKKEAEVEGHKHKKKFKGSEEDLKTLTEWITTLKFEAVKKDKKDASAK